MIKPLTTLRFFFAMMVFTSHLGFVKTDIAWYNWLKRNIFFEGYLGVSFFFILSGFILAYSYKEKIVLKQITNRKFYIARFARIYPLHFLTLLLAIPLVISKGDFNMSQFLSNLFLVQSFIPFQSYYFSFNSPSWSISDEMFFYAVFPFLILIVNRMKMQHLVFFGVITVLLIILIAITPTSIHKTYFYINPILRIIDFILVLLLFELYRTRKFSSYFQSIKSETFFEFFSIALLLVFIAFHNYFDRGYRYSVYYWIPIIFVIYTFAFSKGHLSKLFSTKLMVIGGEISFAFYMIHLVIINYALLFKSQYLSNVNDIIFSLFLFFIICLLSLLIYYFYEKPLNAYLRKRMS